MGSQIEFCHESINFWGYRRCKNCIYCHRERLWKAFPNNFPEGVFFKRLNKLLSWKNKSVFLDSMFDICNEDISDEIAEKFFKIISKADKSNTLILSTKIPKGYIKFVERSWVPKNTYLGVTIETDTYSFQNQKITDADHPINRVIDFADLDWEWKFLLIEPGMKFTEEFIPLIYSIKGLKIIIIGMNSRPDVTLVEPTREEIVYLFDRLSEHYDVMLKDNVKRFNLTPVHWKLKILPEVKTLNAYLR